MFPSKSKTAPPVPPTVRSVASVPGSMPKGKGKNKGWGGDDYGYGGGDSSGGGGALADEAPGVVTRHVDVAQVLVVVLLFEAVD